MPLNAFSPPLSILDNDFYKFTMQQGVISLFPGARVRYRLINRGAHSFPDGFGQVLREKIDQMSTLKLSREEKHFLQVNCPYMNPVYLDFLEGYRYNPEEVHIEQHGDQLSVTIEGLWYRTILWEVPLMAVICELFYLLTGASRISDDAVLAGAREKIENYRKLGITVAEFGTRRRYSYQVHRLVLQAISQYGQGCFIGTSNVHMAMLPELK